MYQWDLQIIEAEGCFTFTAVSDTNSSFTIDDDYITSGINRIINLITTDDPDAVIYIADLTGNQNVIESVMQMRKVSYAFN